MNCLQGTEESKDKNGGKTHSVTTRKKGNTQEMVLKKQKNEENVDQRTEIEIKINKKGNQNLDRKMLDNKTFNYSI